MPGVPPKPPKPVDPSSVMPVLVYRLPRFPARSKVSYSADGTCVVSCATVPVPTPFQPDVDTSKLGLVQKFSRVGLMISVSWRGGVYTWVTTSGLFMGTPAG